MGEGLFEKWERKINRRGKHSESQRGKANSGQGMKSVSKEEGGERQLQGTQKKGEKTGRKAKIGAGKRKIFIQAEKLK